MSFTSLLARESIALGHAMLGDTSQASRSDQLTDWNAPSAAPQLFVSLAQISRAETLHCLGHRHRALALAEEVGHAARPLGQHLSAFLAYFLAARIDSTPTMRRLLGDLVSHFDFDLAHLYIRHVDAIANGESHSLAEVANDYFQRDLRWLGAAAANAAIRTATPAAHRSSSVSSARKSLQAVTASGVLVPGAGEVGPSMLLTPREQEIAEAVAAGHTSAGIAGQLQLSTRTVENHLQRVFRKLGVSKRAELPGALAAQRSRTLTADHGW